MNDDRKIADKSDDSLLPPIVQITGVDALSKEEVATGSSSNDGITNEEVRSDFANVVEIPEQQFDQRIQDVGCTKKS